MWLEKTFKSTRNIERSGKYDVRGWLKRLRLEPLLKNLRKQCESVREGERERSKKKKGQPNKTKIVSFFFFLLLFLRLFLLQLNPTSSSSYFAFFFFFAFFLGRGGGQCTQRMKELSEINNHYL